MIRSSLVLLVLPLLGCVAAEPMPPQTTPRTYAKPQVLCRIQDKNVNESSGIAASRRDPNVYYTHNDSGDSARFFRFTRDGKVTATFDVTNAQAVDWEDMATARFGKQSFIFLGDIGDNAGKRGHIVVYRVPEPSLDQGSGPVRADREYVLNYPDEPHNAETLLVDPKSGDFTIVTKAADRPSMIFRLRHPGRSGHYTLEKQGEISLGGGVRESRLVTGGAVSPDGKYVVLRTYLAAYEYPVPQGGTWWKEVPQKIQTAFELQGEGITYRLDGRGFVTSSEFSPCQISEILRAE